MIKKKKTTDFISVSIAFVYFLLSFKPLIKAYFMYMRILPTHVYVYVWEAYTFWN